MEHPQEYRYRGFEAEEELLGHKLDWDAIKEKNKIPPGKRSSREWREILQNVYPENPIVPSKKWGKDLYNFVAERLELNIDDTESLKFYKSTGTDLDRMGTDCYFVFKNPKTGREAIFTIDVTAKSKEQKDEYKANVIVHAEEIPDHHKNLEAYIQKMQELADYVAETLKNKTEFKIH